MAENALYKRALFKAMVHCSRRESCIDDIRNKLTNWGIGNNDANKIISRLQKENFINETRYATAFVRDKFNYNKWGKIKISAHLRKKNIPDDVIKTELDSIDDEAYKKLLENLIKGHKRSVKAKTQYELKAKLLRYGLSKGFESTLLYDLLNDLED